MSLRSPRSVADVVDLLRLHPRALEEAGITRANLDMMRHRDSISARWDRALIQAAKEFGLPLTYELLARLRDQRLQKTPRRRDQRKVTG